MSSEIQIQSTEVAKAANVEPVIEQVELAPDQQENQVELEDEDEEVEKQDPEELPEFVPDRVYEISELPTVPDGEAVWVKVTDTKSAKVSVNPREIHDKEGNVILNKDGKPKIEIDEDLIRALMPISDYLASEKPFPVNTLGERLGGNHRAMTRMRKGRIFHKVIVRHTKSLEHEKMIALQDNQHGKPLTDAQRNSKAIELWKAGVPDEDIRKLGYSQSTLNRLTKSFRDAQAAQEKAQITDLWFRGESTATVAKVFDTETSPENKASPDYKAPKKVYARVARKIAEISHSAQVSEMGIFRNYSLEGSPLRIPTLWEFESVAVLPAEAFEHLLYYWSDSTDIVFIPFCANGSIIDVSRDRCRRYYACDKAPVRADIREYDIANGLPTSLPVPKLVFLNPFDGGLNSDLNPEVIGNIAREVKRKWDDNLGYLVLVAPMESNDGKTKGLFQACYEQISKYLNQMDLITVSGSKLDTQKLAEAKATRKPLVNTRMIVVFSNGKDKTAPVKEVTSAEEVATPVKEAPEAPAPTETVPPAKEVPEPAKEAPIPEPEKPEQSLAQKLISKSRKLASKNGKGNGKLTAARVQELYDTNRDYIFEYARSKSKDYCFEVGFYADGRVEVTDYVLKGTVVNWDDKPNHTFSILCTPNKKIKDVDNPFKRSLSQLKA